MYLIQIYRNDVFIGDKTVPFGEWNSIGLWLDDVGYNGTGYHIIIRFVEV